MWGAHHTIFASLLVVLLLAPATSEGTQLPKVDHVPTIAELFPAGETDNVLGARAFGFCGGFGTWAYKAASQGRVGPEFASKAPALKRISEALYAKALIDIAKLSKTPSEKDDLTNDWSTTLLLVTDHFGDMLKNEQEKIRAAMSLCERLADTSEIKEIVRLLPYDAAPGPALAPAPSRPPVPTPPRELKWADLSKEQERSFLRQCYEAAKSAALQQHKRFCLLDWKDTYGSVGLDGKALVTDSLDDGAPVRTQAITFLCRLEPSVGARMFNMVDYGRPFQNEWKKQQCAAPN